MGEVYRARDPRLGREVAIKVLPADRLADAERRRRFTQEARAASALNHPHIVTIHEIEVAEGIDFLVMEAVPGKTLDLLIPKQGMPVPELLRVAIPIADALTAAHAHGIVHRDLKPANVIVAPPRTVKVVDFGLAELDGARTDGDGPETLTLPPAPDQSTAGTPPYMSPEQAAGRALDGRSDIFSFGAVLYEMATGRRAFERASVAETLAAVLHEEPRPPRELAPALPASLERLILRCLKKDPDRRFQHASDLKVELEDVRDESAARGAGSTPRSRRVLVLAAAAVLVAAAAVATASRWSWSALPAPTVVQITSEQRAGSGSFSPDGTQVAFSSVGEGSSSWNIWLTIVGEADARRLTSDAKADAFPTWSPDGKQIAFIRYRTKLGRGQFFSYFEAGDIHLVSPLGGSARRLSDFPARLQLAWSPDGRWLAAARARSGHEPPGGIHLISVATGESRALTFPQPPNFNLSPSFSPDGRTLAYASCGGIEEFPMCDVSVLPVDSALQPRQKPQRLTTQRLLNAGIAWTPDGRSIVYGAGIDLWRVRSDGSAAPEPMQVPGRGGFPTTVRGQSRLAFIRPTGLADIYRLELGRTPRPVLESSYPDVFRGTRPDGRRIAFESGRAGGKREVWIADATGPIPYGSPAVRAATRGRLDGRPMDASSRSIRTPTTAAPTSGSSASTVWGCARSRTTARTTSCRAFRATVASSTLRRTGRAAAKSGGSRSQGGRKSRSRARAGSCRSKASMVGPSTICAQSEAGWWRDRPRGERRNRSARAYRSQDGRCLDVASSSPTAARRTRRQGSIRCVSGMNRPARTAPLRRWKPTGSAASAFRPTAGPSSSGEPGQRPTS